MNIGRLKVSVPSLYGPLKDEADLPWCVPCTPSASYKSGTFLLPEVNNTVWVIFEGGETYRPVWIGCVYSANTTETKYIGNTNGQARVRQTQQDEVPEEGWDHDYKVLYKSPSGNVIYYDDTGDGKGIITKEAGGTEVKVETGKISLITAGGIDLVLDDASDDIVIGAGGTQMTLSTNKSTQEVTLANSKSSVKQSLNGVVIDYNEVGSVSIDDSTTQVSYKNSKVKMSDSEVDVVSTSKTSMSNGTSTVVMDGSVVDIKATTVNINADVVNIP